MAAFKRFRPENFHSSVAALQSRLGEIDRPLYAYVVAIVFTALFFTNVPIYGALFLWAIQPIHVLALFGACLFPLLISRPRLSVRLESPYVLWCLGYLVLCCVSYVLFGGYAIGPLLIRVLSLAFMLSMYALFVHSDAIVRGVRFALIGCVLLGVAINIYDISHPFTLIPAGSEYAIIGRAAGLYVNPNQAGFALLLGYLLTIDLCKPGLRPIYTAVVCVGVLLTASRAAIGGVGLVIAFLMYSGTLKTRQILGLAAVSAVPALLLWRIFGPTVGALQIDWGLLLDRLDWFASLGGSADFSQRERLLLAERAWALVVEHPFFGAGLGSTELWAERSSTHNMYLAAMADFGFFAALIFPALVIASAGGLRRGFSRRKAPFVAFLLWAGLFTHNVIGEYYFMISLSLMAASSMQTPEKVPAPTSLRDTLIAREPV